MTARVSVGQRVEAATPVTLFPTGLTSAQNNHPYDVTKDGQRFLVPVRSSTGPGHGGDELDHTSAPLGSERGKMRPVWVA
jgi:hypothetical protein